MASKAPTAQNTGYNGGKKEQRKLIDIGPVFNLFYIGSDGHHRSWNEVNFCSAIAHAISSGQRSRKKYAKNT